MSVEELNRSNIRNPEISIVVPTFNLEEWRVRNCLKSLRLQSEKNIELIVSDYGSDAKHVESMLTISKAFNASLYHSKADEWSIGCAYNVGIRRSMGKFVATIDADIIFEPEVIRDTMNRLQVHANAVIVRQPIFLSKSVDCPNLILPESYPLLDAQTPEYRSPSVGSFTIVNRNWWFAVRGYDERMTLYGSEDWEMWRRANRLHNKIILIGEDTRFQFPKQRVPPNCKLYHQWHQDIHERLSLPKEVVDNQRKVNREVYYLGDQSTVRNNEGWGRMP